MAGSQITEPEHYHSLQSPALCWQLFEFHAAWFGSGFPQELLSRLYICTEHLYSLVFSLLLSNAFYLFFSHPLQGMEIILSNLTHGSSDACFVLT